MGWSRHDLGRCVSSGRGEFPGSAPKEAGIRWAEWKGTPSSTQLSGSALSILEHKYSNELIYSFLTMEISSISVVALLLSREIVTLPLVSNTMS